MKNQHWNLPNILTILRVVLVPFFIVLLLQPSFILRIIAFLIFIVASITDLIDGYLARKWNQETELGKFLDPLADKALVLGAFITFIYLSDQVQTWMVLVIIGRDLLITMLRYIAIHRGKSLQTSRLGKWKTGFQMFSIIVISLSFLLVSYRERESINLVYSDARDRGIDPLWIAIENFYAFIQGADNSIFYGLSTFLPYFLMVLTTLITFISGMRYLITNYHLLLPRTGGSDQ